MGLFLFLLGIGCFLKMLTIIDFNNSTDDDKIKE